LRTFVVLVASALALAVALTASADPSGNAPFRDHGHGRWFKHGCAWQGGLFASCNVNVVTDSTGKPLASSTPPATALAPSQFDSAYALPTVGGAGQTLAIVDAYNDPTAESDLATFSTQFGLPACTTANGCFRKVDQNGGTNYPSASSGWSLEIALDVEIAHGICPSCKILLVEATNNSYTNLFTAENEAVALGANVISNSWGGSEASNESSYDSAFNHPGVVITASTGDNGYGVEYPAASRYVTAVGGTTLHLTTGGAWSSETAWSDAGSGCSSYETKPAWQTDTGCSHRALADVSADADPNTGAAIYVSSYSAPGWYQVGGTSLASPLIAAVYALTGTAANAVYGSTPYAHSSSLHDITSGSNGSCGGSYLCNAVVGFDGPTGLGTPIGLTAFTAGSGGGGGTQTGDYTLAVSPSSASVTAGGATGYTATVTPTGGFSSSVGLSVTGLPSGATGTFSSSSITSGNSTLNVQTSSSTPIGTYPLTISGSGNGTIHTTTVSLSVQTASTSPDFTLSVSPSSGSVSRFGSTTFTVTITPTGGFSSPVTLSASGFALGTRGSFSPDPATTTSTLTVSAGLRIGQGTSTLTITGTGGGKTHTTTVSLTVG